MKYAPFKTPNITPASLFLVAVSLSAVLLAGTVYGEEPELANKENLQEDSQALPTTTWSVSVRAESKPALKYLFWPELQDLERGNSIVLYQRAHRSVTEADAETLETLLDQSNPSFPRDDARLLLEKCEAALSEIRRASVKRDITYDIGWDQLDARQRLEITIPETEHFMILGNLIDLHVRFAIAENRIDDAIDGIRIGFRCAEAAGEIGESILAMLVRVKIAQAMCQQVESLIQKPNSPNLYWALSSVPGEIFDLSQAIMFEIAMWEDFASDMTGESIVDSHDEVLWKNQLLRALKDLNIDRDADDLLSDAEYSSVRGRLIEANITPESILAMSKEEAVLRATKLEYQAMQDDRKKWLLLPMEMRDHLLVQVGNIGKPIADKNEDTESRKPHSFLAGQLFKITAPNLIGMQKSALAVRQHIARLATIEALRDFAATNGDLPNQLNDIERLPPWPDPVTREPFAYEKLGPKIARISNGNAWPTNEHRQILLRLTE